MSSGRHAFQTCICSLIGFNSYFVLYLMRCFGNNPLYMDFKPITILFCSVCFLCCVIVSVFVCLRSVSVGLNVASVYRSRSQALEYRTPPPPLFPHLVFIYISKTAAGPRNKSY